jgi:phage repressor protein C with HTH and peptisase S24 domain
MTKMSAENTLSFARFRAFLNCWFESSGLNKTKAGEFFGVTQGNFTNILKGERSVSLKGMEKFAKRLEIDLTELLNRGKAILEPAGESLTPESDASEPFPLVKVPVFDAGAGELSGFILNWREYELSEDDDFIYVTPQEKKNGAFGIKVNGDSMAPTIERGDIVICMPTRSIENGKAVLACWPGSEADPGKRLIKWYKSDEHGNVVLWSDNKNYEPITLSKKEMRDIHLCRVTKLVKDL